MDTSENQRTHTRITESAAINRVNRQRGTTGTIVRVARGDRAIADLGRYYRVDSTTGVLIEKDVDLAAYARKLGVLRAFECVEGGE